MRNNNRTKEWLQAEGLLRGGSIAEMGYDIASLACEDVFDRLKNGDITARQAYNICHASNTEKGQMVACRLIKEGKSLEYVNSYVREADRIVSGTEGDYDLFGNDDSWVRECEQVAEYVTKSVALINERLGILKKSNGLVRKKGKAEKMGIRLETPEGIKSHIIALERLKQEYQHHDTRLNIHGSALAWDGKSELNPFTHVREDEGGSGSFSLISPESIHAHWKESLEEYLSGKNPKKDRDITVCPTPAVLRMLGAKAHDLVITPGVIDKVMHDKHAVSREAMEGLSLAIENPIAVFESATSANSLVLLTELKEGENNIVVAVQLNDKSGRISVNRVKSVYGKEDARALLCSSCFYWDIKKARLWLTASGLQLSAAVPSTKGRRRTMLKPADIVKWKDKNNVSFSVVSTDNRGTFDENNPDMSLSITQARHKGILSNGVIEAQNGTVVEPDVSFSLFAWHASPHSFRKFDTSKMGSGEGNQAYGWGVYLSTNKQVHDFYVDTFKKQGDVSQYVIEVNAKESQLMPWRYLESSIDKALSLSPIEELRYIANNSPESGRQVYEELMEAYWDGADDTKQGAMRQASEALLKSGIKGIKYEDGVSSNSITGRTFNYVIFDQDDIKITNVSDGGGWREYNDPEASFSVVSMDNTGKSLSAETFITKKDGNPDWFVIPKRAGQKEMPVRLLVGEDKAYHKGYGLNHLVASRVEDDLWEKTSPAKYISDILENASELYEVSPGRELLVKGKQPSSWMVLQLDRQEGYYSIITAYPARLGQKPLGRKISLAERSVAQRQLPTNTESGTVRLEGGSVANATLQPSFAGEKSATQLPAGSDSVNIKDVICQLNDGGTLPASFSLTTSESLWTRMYEAEFDAKLGTLHKKGAKSIEDWRKVCAAQDTPVAKIAEVYGEVMATVSAMYKVLPVGFRFAVEPYMKKATNAATELEGKEFLSPEMKGMRAKNVTQRMGEVMDSLLVRSEVQLEKYIKARIKRDMDKALKSLKIKKAPNGKSKKGKLSADNYRKLEEYTSMLNAKEEDKEEQVSILEGILQNTQSTEEQRDKAEESFADWAVFGCWKSMGIAEAKNAYASLMEFITAGRTLWAEKQERNRLTNKRKAELVVEAVGTGNANDYRKVKEDAKASLPSKAKSFVTYGFKSFSQMLLSLSGDANLKEWMNNEISDIAKANVLLRNMSNERMANVDGLIKRVAGLKKDKEARQWLTKFKKTRDTGIALNPTGEKTVKVTIEEARRLVAMTYAEREGERKKITADYHKRGMSAREAIVPEQAIALLKTRLGEIDGTILAPQKPRGGIKYITVKAVIESPYKTVSLKVSPAQAMYTILLSEQAGYSENLASAGIGESELQALREFVGADGLAFGYGLRQLMNKQGDLLAHVYEEREGVPFPRVENYYRAVFKIDHKNVEGRGFGEAGATGAIGGGAKYGMLIQRRKHSLDLAWDTDCVAVFKAATAEVDNYIATSGITSRWRSILSDRYAAPSLMRHLGKHGYDSLRQWLNIIDGAGVVEGGAMLAQAQLVSHFQGARAIALLSHNFITLAKQLSGLLHGNISGEVKISSHVKGLAKVMVGTGKISLSEMMATDAFNARQSNHKELESIMTYASDQNYNEVMRFAMAGMNAIERMDIFSNAVSMAALYDAKWNELNDINKEAEDKMTEEEMHAMCMVSVTRAMELSAQPLSATQKSLMGNSQNAGAKILCFMGGETLNKFGLMLSHISAGKYLTAIALYAEMSLAEQSIIALYNALLSDDEEWAKKGGWLGYLQGAPLAMLGGVPLIGSAIEEAYGYLAGNKVYIGTSSGVVDYGSFFRAWKKTYEAIHGKKNKKGEIVKKEMTFSDWATIITADIKACAFIAGAGRTSRHKAIDGIASWLLSASAATNMAKPAVKIAKQQEREEEYP